MIPSPDSFLATFPRWRAPRISQVSRTGSRPGARRGGGLLGGLLGAVLLAFLSPLAAYAEPPQAAAALVLVDARYAVEVGDTTELHVPIDLLAFASDADGDALTFSIAKEPTAGEEPAGLLVDHGAGLFVFRIDDDELTALKEIQFDYTVADATGGSKATVTIRRNQALPTAPKSGGDFFTVPVDKPSPPLQVLENDEDVDSIASFTSGGLGEVTLSADKTALVFTPGEGFGPGVTDTFTYVPSGPGGTGSTTEVKVTGEKTIPPTPLAVFQHWDFAAVTNGSTVPFTRQVPVDTFDSHRFDLYNPTNEVLEITNATTAISGECFSQVNDPAEKVPSTVEASDVPPPELPDGQLAPGFRVRVYCPTAGTHTGTVTLETRSASGVVYAPFTFAVTVEVVDGPLRPTPLVVRQHWDGAIIANGAHIRYPNHAIFNYPTSMAVDVENPTTETIDILNPNDAIHETTGGWWPLPGAPIPDFVDAGKAALFRVQLHWDIPETVSFRLVLDTASASGERYEPFSFTVEATLVVPEADVFRGWPNADPNAIADSEVIELPTIAAAGDHFHSVAFQIRNVGQAGMLVVENPDASLVDGECFVVKPGGFPASTPIGLGQQTPFRVWWGGSCGPGTYTAKVWVTTNAYEDAFNLSQNWKSFTIVGHVAPAPDFTCEPADTRVVAGATVNFEVCVSNDDGSFDYAWFKDDEPIAGSGPILSLSGVTDADEGAYHVEVAGDLPPVASSAARLSVVEKPVVSRPADQTVSPGATATFSVVVGSEADDGPFGYFWQRLPPGASTFETIAGATTDRLTLSGVTEAMNGTRYRCLVGNQAGQTSSGSALLTVLSGPVITQHPQSQRVVAGANVSFSVAANGTPAPTYLWTRNGASLGVTTPTLSLSSVQDANEGTYRVTVSNSQGSITSQAASLTVVNKPVVSRPANQAVPAGGTATFSVTVSSPSADGPFGYVWQQLAPGASSFQTISGATSDTLTVSNVTLAMHGTRYRCIVGNDAGQTNSGDATLAVRTPDVRVTRNWDGLAVGEGTTFDFGTVERNLTSSRLFRITNVGDATLTISNPTNLVGGSCFSQISNAASSVSPGGYTTFRVRLLCSSTGIKTGQVTVHSDDSSSPYVFYLRGNVVASDVLVSQAWDGATVAPGTTVNFGSVETGVATSRRFRITNTGQATLTISNPTSLVGGTCWSQIENAASSVAPGATTYFRVRLYCGTSGTKGGTITIHTNDPSSPYVFYVRGTVTDPAPGDVTVYRDWNGVVQPEGQTFPFPNISVGTSASRRFRITNTGSGTLTISNPTSFVSGTCWSQIENAASTVAPGASTYFRVRLMCSSTGTKTGTVTIYSNDTSSPYRFFLSGTVTQ